jgi:hypothetical protein
MQIYHTIYQTTNLINGKTYIGKHSTTNLNDNYLGSGLNINRAIKKYGKENFKKEILLILQTEQSAFLWEDLIVDHNFTNNPFTYNLKGGGRGGMKGLPTSEATKEKLRTKRSPEDCIAKSIRQTGTKRSETTKQKQREAAFTSAHMSKTFKAISPNGDIIIDKNFSDFCRCHNFPKGSSIRNIGIGKIPPATVSGKVRKLQPPYVGWEFNWV